MGAKWKVVSHTIPDFGTELAKMLDALTTGPHAWHGKAAQEFENIVKQINQEIQKLADDTGKLSSNLNDAGNVLSDAVANIPVPLLRAGHWYSGGNEHKLPGGTDMDDGRKMHQGVGGFIDTLRADYEGNKDAYRDFKQAVKAEYDGPTPTRNNFKYDLNDPTVPAGDLRSGTQKGAAYRGDFSRINAWYEANAKIADQHFTSLKDSYVEHRGQYEFDGQFQPLDLAIAPGSHQTPPGGGMTDYGAAGAGAAGLGAAGLGAAYDPQGFDPSSVLTNWSGARNEPAGGFGIGSSDSISDGRSAPGGADVGSRLAGSGSTAGAWPSGSAGLGGGLGGGGLGTGGIGGGGVGAGSAGVGASRYEGPMPPVTTPPEPTLRPGAGTRPGAGRAGMGMMPHPGAGGDRGGRDERTTWLTEDEDVFAPKYLGPETNSAGAIE